MPEYNNSHGELLPGARYARGGVWDSGEGGECAVIGCARPKYQDNLCVVHWCYRETIKPEIHYPQLEGHKYPPGYYTLL